MNYFHGFAKEHSACNLFRRNIPLVKFYDEIFCQKIKIFVVDKFSDRISVTNEACLIHFSQNQPNFGLISNSHIEALSISKKIEFFSFLLVPNTRIGWKELNWIEFPQNLRFQTHSKQYLRDFLSIDIHFKGNIFSLFVFK